ncbi:MAG TPA: hypothetical protein VF250_14470 [Conexibacter sp.]
MKISRVLLATASASVLLGALASCASARGFSLSNQSMRATFTSVEITIFEEVRCQLTLEGSFHSRTIAKVARSLIGYITRAVVGPCNGTTATILRETLPWHVRYQGFLGALPDITSITTHVIGAGLRLGGFGFACLVGTTEAEPGILTYDRNNTTREITEARISGRIRTGGECFRITGSFGSDPAPVSLLGTSSTRIAVTLI